MEKAQGKNELKQMKCAPCHQGATTVSGSELAELVEKIPYWKLVPKNGILQLERDFFFQDFASALDFTNRIGVLAEAENHHPTLTTEWGKVTVCWWTHTVKGLHRNDFIMAANTDIVYGEAQESAKRGFPPLPGLNPSGRGTSRRSEGFFD
jgi:4a-hydroxytetrahydrobiopterin dehydratase